MRQAAIAAHIPVLHKNNYSWSNTIFIHNVSSSTASVTVNFKPSTAGSTCTPSAYSIPAQGLIVLDLRTISCIGSTFIGSAWITSNQPVAIASSQNHYNAGGLIDSLMESEFVDSASTTAYAPLIQNYN